MSEYQIEFVDLKAQYSRLRHSIDNRIQQVLDHGRYILGPEVQELEDDLASYVEVRNCITVASGTEALLITLMALGIEQGDEVITTPFSFVSTAEVIVTLGAIPVFVDIQPDNCNIDPAAIEAAITEKTKAIIPVSLYGQPADMDEINAIAAKYGNIPVVEDAAQSFGSIYNGRHSCNLSTVGCTSFFPSKPLGCYGDGGAIFTDDDDMAEVMRQIRVHGQSHRYHHSRVGVGGRMDTIQCAVLLAKLDNFGWEIQQRIEIGNIYLDLLEAYPSVKTIVVPPDRTCVWSQFTILIEDRENVIEKLKDAGIPTAVHYAKPLHRQPAYMSKCRISGGLSMANESAKRVLSLPMHPYLDITTQKMIIQAIADAVSQQASLASHIA
jgi:UDP-2-acetamido-2-deoxy-ribo-hexuluronate aminotransferase